MEVEPSSRTPATALAEASGERRSGNGRRKGLHRHLVLIIDGGFTMTNRDFSPSRYEVVLHAVSFFIAHFFEENPLSQMQLIVTSDGLAKPLTPLSGNPAQHLRALKQRGAIQCEGDISIRNALDLAVLSLKNIARYGTREVLFLISALSTCDPGPLAPTIAALLEYQINAMYVCQQIASQTGGEYGAAENESHFLELLKARLQLTNLHSLNPGRSKSPSPCSVALSESHIVLGTEMETYLRLWCSHQNLTREGYYCPRCNSKQCHIPTHCSVCGLTLASSADLSISYRHLFPVEVFQSKAHTTAWNCFSCDHAFQEKPVATPFQCPKCELLFCDKCDELIHFESHVCPGCI